MVSSHTAYLCILAALLISCKAIVDTYVYHNGSFDESIRSAATQGFTFDSELDNAVSAYTCDGCDSCKEQVKHQEWYGSLSGVLQALLYDLNGQGKAIDTKTYEETQTCNGDKECEDAANKRGEDKIQTLTTTFSKKINDFKSSSIKQVTDYIDKCLTEQNA